MKPILCMAVAVLHAVGLARGEEPYFDFARSGDVVDIEKKVKRKTRHFKEVRVPIDRVLEDQSFECSFHASFPGWGHYAEITAGIAGLEARFNKGDDRKRRVYLPTESYDFPKGKDFILVLRYCSFTRSISAMVKDSEGSILHKTRWKKTYRKCPVRDFRVTARATDGTSDEFTSSITTDKAAGTIFARSRIGRSYFISADISNIAIKVMKDGFEDRLDGVD